MPSIFLSHSHRDTSFANNLASDLRSRGIRVWVDEGELQIGDSITRRLESAIDEMEYLGVVLSPHSVESEWVQREVRQALATEIRGKKVKVLPILLSDCVIPGFLRDKLYADFRLRSNFSEVVDVLARRILDSDVRKDETTSGPGGTWGVKTVRLGLANGVLVTSGNTVVFSERFEQELRREAGKVVSKRLTMNIGRMHSRLIAAAVLECHTGRGITIDDLAYVVSEVGPHVLNYLVDLAIASHLLTGEPSKFDLAKAVRSELIEILAERRTKRPLVALILDDIVKNFLLAHRGNMNDHHLLTIALWYVLAGSSFHLKLRSLFRDPPASRRSRRTRQQ